MLSRVCRPLGIGVRAYIQSAGLQSRCYRAAVLKELNKPLVIEKILSQKELKPEQIRVGVHYCSLNYTDVKAFEGGTGEVKLPVVPGSEFSGEVLEVGSADSSEFRVGDRVVALKGDVSKDGGGGLAGEAIVHQLDCWKLSNLSLKDAAILPYGHGTAMLVFNKFSPIDENDIVIVIAGPGGLGLAAIEVAASVYKAKVIAVCDTEDSSVVIREEGAFQTISMSEGIQKVYKFLRNALGENRAAVIYDAVGQGHLHLLQDFLCPKKGKLVSVYPLFDADKFKAEKPDVEIKKKYKLDTKFERSIEERVQHVDLYSFGREDKDFYRQVIEETFELYEEELISAHISKVFQLSEMEEAIEYIRKKKCTGKVLIEVKEPEKKDTDDD